MADFFDTYFPKKETTTVAPAPEKKPGLSPKPISTGDFFDTFFPSTSKEPVQKDTSAPSPTPAPADTAQAIEPSESEGVDSGGGLRDVLGAVTQPFKDIYGLGQDFIKGAKGAVSQQSLKDTLLGKGQPARPEQPYSESPSAMARMGAAAAPQMPTPGEAKQFVKEALIGAGKGVYRATTFPTQETPPMGEPAWVSQKRLEEPVTQGAVREELQRVTEPKTEAEKVGFVVGTVVGEAPGVVGASGLAKMALLKGVPWLAKAPKLAEVAADVLAGTGYTGATEMAAGKTPEEVVEESLKGGALWGMLGALFRVRGLTKEIKTLNRLKNNAEVSPAELASLEKEAAGIKAETPKTTDVSIAEKDKLVPPKQDIPLPTYDAEGKVDYGQEFYDWLIAKGTPESQAMAASSGRGNGPELFAMFQRERGAVKPSAEPLKQEPPAAKSAEKQEGIADEITNTIKNDNTPSLDRADARYKALEKKLPPPTNDKEALNPVLAYKRRLLDKDVPQDVRESSEAMADLTNDEVMDLPTRAIFSTVINYLKKTGRKFALLTSDDLNQGAINDFFKGKLIANGKKFEIGRAHV